MTVPAVKPKSTFTEEEYLLLEEHALDKSEFYDGEIFAMSGGSLDHSTIATNLGGLITTHLRRTTCRGYNSDARVSIPGKSYFYPDFTVVCGKTDVNRVGKQEAIATPSIIFEVLSESTEEFDRNGKFERYRTIPTLEQYVLIDSQKFGVWSYLKEENWKETHPLLGFDLSFIKLRISLEDIYYDTSVNS